MNTVSFTPIAEGIEGCFVQTTRFKTTRISIHLLVPLNKETVSANAILPFLLTRSLADYRDFTALSRKLDELYGASVYGDVSKYGDMQVLKLAIGCIDDRFAGNEAVTKECAKLILSMLFSPALSEDGLFIEEAFQSEKRQLCERIDGELNEKRLYAMSKAISEICKGEPHGIPKYGYKKEAEALGNAEVIKALQTVLKTAYVRINVVGAGGAEQIFSDIAAYFSKIGRQPVSLSSPVIPPAKNPVSKTEERMEVTQGKLVLGFRTPGAKTLKESIAFRVMTDLFGGGPYSLLFKHVREEQSLCYYCAARYNRQKGFITVDSGVEEENAETAKTEILKQFESVKSGDFSDDTLSASLLGLTGAAKTLSDLPSSLDEWYFSQTFDEKPVSPEEYAEQIGAVTKADIVKAAGQAELDTIYFLHGLGE